MRIGDFVPWGTKQTRRRTSRTGWIIAENGCHIWQGARNGQGYGVVEVNGVRQGAYAARYEREVAPVPKGMVVDHFVCNNPPCCNPAHMKVVTQRENLLRSHRTLAAQNVAKTHCPQGHALIPENLDKWQLSRGSRSCKICKAQKQLARSRRSHVPQTPLGMEIHRNGRDQ